MSPKAVEEEAIAGADDSKAKSSSPMEVAEPEIQVCTFRALPFSSIAQYRSARDLISPSLLPSP